MLSRNANETHRLALKERKREFKKECDRFKEEECISFFKSLMFVSSRATKANFQVRPHFSKTKYGKPRIYSNGFMEYSPEYNKR